jgi:hypothetical protein
MIFLDNLAIAPNQENPVGSPVGRRTRRTSAGIPGQRMIERKPTPPAAAPRGLEFGALRIEGRESESAGHKGRRLAFREDAGLRHVGQAAGGADVEAAAATAS